MGGFLPWGQTVLSHDFSLTIQFGESMCTSAIPLDHRAYGTHVETSEHLQLRKWKPFDLSAFYKDFTFCALFYTVFCCLSTEYIIRSMPQPHNEVMYIWEDWFNSQPTSTLAHGRLDLGQRVVSIYRTASWSSYLSEYGLLVIPRCQKISVKRLFTHGRLGC